MGAAPMRLRNSFIGQFLLVVIVGSIVLAFALTGSGAASRGGLVSWGDECALRVGRSCVDPKEFNAAFGLVVSVGLNEKAVKQLDLKREVARGLAEREVLLEEAERLGIGTSEKAIDAELIEGRTRVSLPAKNRRDLARSLALCVEGEFGCAPGTLGLRGLPVTQKGSFDYPLYERVIRRTTGRSPGHFKEMQMREFTAERMRQLITDGVRVSPEEAFLGLERTQSKVVARQLITSSTWFERFVAPPSAEELEKYKASHSAEIDAALASEKARYLKGCPVVQELFLSAGGARSDAESESALKKLLTSLGSASSRERVIREESEAENARLGGRVGCLDASYGVGFEELLKAARELNKPGAVTPVIRTARGFHALVLEAIVSDENAESLARAAVTYRLAAHAQGLEAAKQFATSVIAAVKAGASLEPTSEAELDRVVSKLSPRLAAQARASESRPKTDVTAPLTIEQNPLPEAVSGEPPAKLLFALDGPDAVLPEPLSLSNGFAVLQLKEKDLYTREKFAKDGDKLVAELVRRKADQVLADYVERLILAQGGVSYDNRFAPTTREVKAGGTDKAPAQEAN
jgi:hypothetical protein